MRRLLEYSSLFRLYLFFCLIAACGCGSAETISVSGTVYHGDSKLTWGTVTYNPVKGNVDGKTAVAQIGEDGKYSIESVVAGSYKVTVVAEESGAQGGKEGGKEGEEDYAVPKYIVADKYMDVTSTPLTVEVKADAPEGHYDLKLEKKK